MNILAAAAILLLMIDPVCAQTNEANPEKRLTGKPPPAIQNLNISRGGSRPSSQAAADRFTGSVRVDPLFQTNESARASGAYVTFAPGARSAWHTHPLGQTLIVMAGCGWWASVTSWR